MNGAAERVQLGHRVLKGQPEDLTLGDPLVGAREQGEPHVHAFTVQRGPDTEMRRSRSDPGLLEATGGRVAEVGLTTVLGRGAGVVGSQRGCCVIPAGGHGGPIAATFSRARWARMRSVVIRRPAGPGSAAHSSPWAASPNAQDEHGSFTVHFFDRARNK